MNILDPIRNAFARRAARKNPRLFVDCTCGERYSTEAAHRAGRASLVIRCAARSCRNILRVSRDPITDELNRVK